MNTPQLTAIIGRPISTGVIKHRFGNATLHARNHISCDPCYLPDELFKKINAAYRERYPWTGYDYRTHHDQWCEFTLDGQTCYARDCGDGTGYFDNCVDSGWVVCLPCKLVPDEVMDCLMNFQPQ